MKEGKWYYEPDCKMFLKFISVKNGEYNFKHPLHRKPAFLFFNFNPYPEFLRDVTKEEIEKYDLK